MLLCVNVKMGWFKSVVGGRGLLFILLVLEKEDETSQVSTAACKEGLRPVMVLS